MRQVAARYAPIGALSGLPRVVIRLVRSVRATVSTDG
jgi:hypothetical protein